MLRAKSSRDAPIDGRRRLIEQLLDDGLEWELPGGYSIVDPYLLVLYQWGGRVWLALPAAWKILLPGTKNK
jgi:hypothetical protein